MSFNQVTLLGNLTADPELRFLQDKTPVVSFRMASNRKWRSKSGEDREEVCFIDLSAFGKQAEVISQFCQKGKQLLVSGRLRFETWDDKQSGQKRSKHTIVVENFTFVGGRADGDGQQQETPRSSRPTGGGKPVRREPVAPPFGDEQTVSMDDVPFAWEGRRQQMI